MVGTCGEGEGEAEGTDQGCLPVSWEGRAICAAAFGAALWCRGYRGASLQARAPVHHHVTLNPTCAWARPSPRTEAGAALILWRKHQGAGDVQGERQSHRCPPLPRPGHLTGREPGT